MLLRIPLLFLIGLLINCNNNLASKELREVSISLHFPSNAIGDSIVMAECLDSFSSPNIIRVNNKSADSIFEKIAYWKTMKIDTFFIVDIVYDNQIYLDTLILPVKIDSVFCNEKYLFNVLTDSLNIINIDTSSIYCFSWKTKRKSGYYYFECQSNMKDSYSKGIITTDTFFNVARQNISDTYFDFSFQLRIWLSENPGRPYKTINGISTFYQWESPRYINHFFVKAQ